LAEQAAMNLISQHWPTCSLLT